MADWDRRFLDLASFISGWSKDPSTKTGAVIVRPDKTIASVGYNGFPRGLDDRQEYYDDRPTKYSRTVHCEMNALLHAREPIQSYTLFTTPFMSCDRCAVHMLQAGITRFVYPKADADAMTRWAEAFERTTQFFSEAGVEYIEYPQ